MTITTGHGPAYTNVKVTTGSSVRKTERVQRVPTRIEISYPNGRNKTIIIDGTIQ
jgi:hypothetical protein